MTNYGTSALHVKTKSIFSGKKKLGKMGLWLNNAVLQILNRNAGEVADEERKGKKASQKEGVNRSFPI